jgi:hypothetical protein
MTCSAHLMPTKYEHLTCICALNNSTLGDCCGLYSICDLLGVSIVILSFSILYIELLKGYCASTSLFRSLVTLGLSLKVSSKLLFVLLDSSMVLSFFSATCSSSILLKSSCCFFLLSFNNCSSRWNTDPISSILHYY